MSWLRDLAQRPPPDVSGRAGAERVGYQFGRGLVVALVALAVVALVVGAWWLVQVLG